MLCETCSNDLKNCHFLIQTALKSHDTLQQTYEIYNQSTDLEEKLDVKAQMQDSGEFESVFFEKLNERIDNAEDIDSLSSIKDETPLEISEDFGQMTVQKKSKAKKVLYDNKSKLKRAQNHNKSKANKKTLKPENVDENLEEHVDISTSPTNDDTEDDKVKVVTTGGRKTRRIMCAYCRMLKIIVNLKLLILLYPF